MSPLPVICIIESDELVNYYNDTDWTEIASRTIKYSAVCSTGFYFAWLVAIFIYWYLKPKANNEADALLWYDVSDTKNTKLSEDGSVVIDSAVLDSSDAGRFGKFMLCVEMIDAIPETAIIANATVSFTISWAFVIAIFALNFCNGLTTAMDFLSKNCDMQKGNVQEKIRIVLYICMFFAVGILSYSISANIYSDFVRKFDSCIRTKEHLLVLFAGTIFGAGLIAGLLRVEDWLHHKSQMAGEVSVTNPKFITRCWQCFLLFTMVWLWTVSLSYALAAIFWVFVENDQEAYIESGLEGLSGGAFLATVAGTMIPRITEDAFRIQWSDVKKKLVGVLMFEFGIIAGVVIDAVT